MRKGALAALVIAVALGAAETWLRLRGAIDFPVWLADNRIGYLPAPDQSGDWRLPTGERMAYRFNELSMQNDHPYHPGGITLVGDSIVYGIPHLARTDRLGYLLEKATGLPVWSAAAGSWSFQNELQYLADRPNVRGDMTVIVINPRDFERPTSWRSERTHPRSRPWSAIAYDVNRRWTQDRDDRAPPPNLRVAPRDLATMLGAQRAKGPLLLLLYPMQKDARDGSCAAFPSLVRSHPDAFCLASDPRWNGARYHGDIHPSAQGTAVLARIIAERIAAPRRPA